MTQITVTVDDAEVRTKLQRVTLAVENLPEKVIRAEMETAKEAARIYPSELPGQRYKRTGKRYDATRLEKIEKGKYKIVSNPRYKYGQTGNPYVLGDSKGQGQAQIHQGRWLLMFDVVNRAIERIRQKGEEYFRAILERNGAP